jgi:predicted 2-oxoglutarate/Fe(II)-dependent dioxygenase YbiX
MLSNSDEYDGGEFYVAKRCDSEESNFNDHGNGGKINIKIIRTCCPKLAAGDLVIFRAEKKGGYDHGMKEVTKGERIAVGLLQPK